MNTWLVAISLMVGVIIVDGHYDADHHNDMPPVSPACLRAAFQLFMSLTNEDRKAVKELKDELDFEGMEQLIDDKITELIPAEEREELRACVKEFPQPPESLKDLLKDEEKKEALKACVDEGTESAGTTRPPPPPSSSTSPQQGGQSASSSQPPPPPPPPPPHDHHHDHHHHHHHQHPHHDHEGHHEVIEECLAEAGLNETDVEESAKFLHLVLHPHPPGPPHRPRGFRRRHGPPRGFPHPPRDFSGPPRGFSGPHRGSSGPPRGFSGPPPGFPHPSGSPPPGFPGPSGPPRGRNRGRGGGRGGGFP